MKITKELLIQAAEELNEVMGLRPPIDVKEDEDLIKAKILKALELREEEDEFSPEVEKVLTALETEVENEEETTNKEKETKEDYRKNKPKAKEKTSSKKKEKKTKPFPTPAELTRVEAMVEALGELAGKTETIDKIIQRANEIYVENGGKSNLKEAKSSFKTVTKAFQYINLLKVEEDSVSVSETFPKVN